MMFWRRSGQKAGKDFHQIRASWSMLHRLAWRQVPGKPSARTCIYVDHAIKAKDRWVQCAAGRQVRAPMTFTMCFLHKAVKQSPRPLQQPLRDELSYDSVASCSTLGARGARPHEKLTSTRRRQDLSAFEACVDEMSSRKPGANFGFTLSLIFRGVPPRDQSRKLWRQWVALAPEFTSVVVAIACELAGPA